MASRRENSLGPENDWVNTGAGGEDAPSTRSMGGTPGSGANEITRANFPNADPDGYDVERSDLEGIDIADTPTTD